MKQLRSRTSQNRMLPPEHGVLRPGAGSLKYNDYFVDGRKAKSKGEVLVAIRMGKKVTMFDKIMKETSIYNPKTRDFEVIKSNDEPIIDEDCPQYGMKSCKKDCVRCTGE